MKWGPGLSFLKLAVDQGGARSHQRDGFVAVDALPAGLAASSSLNAMAMLASREPPLVTLVRYGMVARLGLRPPAHREAASNVIRSVPRRG
jgi:hypothetical protein